ncbi:MAG: AraC family transcriptional regulator, partial [Flavobacteriaceae bacterium]|nr:AraC family transcriptional regulator [Flavobacteriaceae bacterium]
MSKPTLEKIRPEFGSSLLVRQHTTNAEMKRAYWHFHPELELVYVNKGQGKRHIGNHLSYFNNSQLIFIGENLPHNGFVDRLTEKGKETIVQFRNDFLGPEFFDMPEMKEIKKLFKKAKKGIVYKPETKKILGPKIENLVNIKGVERVSELLKILQHLATTDDYQLLNVDGFAFESAQQDSARIDKIFNYVNDHFTEQIPLQSIADEVSMTVPA